MTIHMLRVVQVHLGNSVINQVEIIFLCVEENVLWLKIAMEDPFLVYALHNCYESMQDL
jgi:hypothetical protein